MRTIAAAALVLLLTACGGESSTAGPPASTSSPSSSTRVAEFDYDENGIPIEPGTYLVPKSPWSAVDFTVTFPDDWTAQYSHLYAGNADGRSELGFYAVVVDEIFTDSCGGDTDGVPMEVAPGTAALVRALRHQPGPRVSKPVDVTFGGQPAVRLEFRIPESLDLSTCRLAIDGVDGLQIWESLAADKYFVLLPDSVYTAHIVDVEGQHQVFLSWVMDDTTPEDLAELQAVLDSIRITS